MQQWHRATITWSHEQETLGLPQRVETIDPAKLGDGGEGWSLVMRFDKPPAEQGNPSDAQVRFLVDEAPHAVLQPGRELRVFERATGQWARIRVTS